MTHWIGIFFLDVLEALHFPETVRNWIRECITSPRFSVNINGEMAGFFSSSRGLRQGDPLSPYLFVLAMEVFSSVILQQITSNPSFRFHWRCRKMTLTHLLFADDVLLLSHGDAQSIRD